MPPPGDGSGGRREGVRMRFKRAGLLTKVVVMVLLIYMATALLDLHGQIQTIQVEREELNQQVAAQQLETSSWPTPSKTATILTCWSRSPGTRAM